MIGNVARTCWSRLPYGMGVAGDDDAEAHFLEVAGDEAGGFVIFRRRCGLRIRR